MSTRTTSRLLVALVCVLVGRLVADAQDNQQTVKLTRAAYPVADLVVPLPDGESQPGRSHPTSEDKLMALVYAAVAPSSWLDHGGSGTMQYYPLGMSLVVHQTPAVHAEIAKLFTALRRLQSIEVPVELRLVSMTAEAGAHFRTKAGFTSASMDDGTARPTALFTEKELYPWLCLLQSDPATEIMVARKLTMADGQQASVNVVTETASCVTEYKLVRGERGVAVMPHTEKIALGMQCKLQPLVSADRRTVRLKVDFCHTSLTAPPTVLPVAFKVAEPTGAEREFRGALQQPHVHKLALHSSFRIPAGQTLAVSLGTRTTDVVSESGPPVLSELPIVRRLFVNVGYGREQREVFLLISPRVIMADEVEASCPARPTSR